MEFTITAQFPVPVSEIYNSWLNGDQHAAMTGAPATGKAEIGAEFTAWDGYISGKNLELTENEKIIQAWRTSEFREEDEDSLLEVYLKPFEGGCKLTLVHSRIPENQPDYEQGWEDHYFAPMKDCFSE
jgi:activator of HSP90 ATPase